MPDPASIAQKAFGHRTPETKFLGRSRSWLERPGNQNLEQELTEETEALSNLVAHVGIDA